MKYIDFVLSDISDIVMYIFYYRLCLRKRRKRGYFFLILVNKVEGRYNGSELKL